MAAEILFIRPAGQANEQPTATPTIYVTRLRWHYELWMEMEIASKLRMAAK